MISNMDGTQAGKNAGKNAGMPLRYLGISEHYMPQRNWQTLYFGLFALVAGQRQVSAVQS